MQISESMRAELLLESVGLTRQEQLMIRTAAAAKEQTFEAFAVVLQEHHGKIHLKDSPTLAPQYRVNNNPGKGKGSSQGTRPWYQSSNRVANWADASVEEEEQEPWHEPEEEYPEYRPEWEDHGYVAASAQEEPESTDYVEDEFIACALIAMADCDMDKTPEEGLDDLAEAAQKLYVGYVAAGMRKGKAKGKGKGKGKPRKGKRIFKTQLTVGRRKQRLADLKSRRCSRCGLQGHWAGDPSCKMTGQKKPQSTAVAPQTGFLATISDSDGADWILRGSCQGRDADLSAYMAYRTPVSRARGPPSSAAGSMDDSFSMVSDLWNQRWCWMQTCLAKPK